MLESVVLVAVDVGDLLYPIAHAQAYLVFLQVAVAIVDVYAVAGCSREIIPHLRVTQRCALFHILCHKSMDQALIGQEVYFKAIIEAQCNILPRRVNC